MWFKNAFAHRAWRRGCTYAIGRGCTVFKKVFVAAAFDVVRRTYAVGGWGAIRELVLIFRAFDAVRFAFSVAV